MFRARTSQDFLWGSITTGMPSALAPENDLLRRSSGRAHLEVEVEGLKMALRAEAAVEEEEEEDGSVGLRWFEAAGSKPARRSRRHEAQNPVTGWSGWRWQEERRGGGGGGGSRFIAQVGLQCAPQKQQGCAC